MSHLRRFVDRHPRLKRLLRRARAIVPGRGVSTNYVEIGQADALSDDNPLHQSWKDDGIPARQRALVDRQLAEFRRGKSVPAFDVLMKSLRELPDRPARPTLLEIGCSSGYHAEVLEIARFPADYAGCDYSEPFIVMARERYPGARFDVEDATRLSYADEAFDIVVSGCCLLHIPAYETAVAETARVARRYAIFQRTPVVVGTPTRYYRKQAYGVETVEIHFSEPEFLALLERHGLGLIATYTLDETISQGRGTATRTYACRKKTA